MRLHDWTRVDAGTFHDFHNRWNTHLMEALNDGILPPDYYALCEQHVGKKQTDVLALHAGDPDRVRTLPLPSGGGTQTISQAPPKASRTSVMKFAYTRLRKTLTIRDAKGHRIVALIEIVSPGNKASPQPLAEFVQKAEQALNAGIHLVVLDVLPPGRLDPQGLHANILGVVSTEDYLLPAPHLRTFVSYHAEPEPVAYLEHPAVGDEIPTVPLFLASDHYVNLPLAATYQTTYRGVPRVWREVIEAT